MCKAVILFSLFSTQRVKKSESVCRILLESKGEISLKAVLEAFNINTLAEMFGQECQKEPNCWELKEFSKRKIILTCHVSFGLATAKDKITI